MGPKRTTEKGRKRGETQEGRQSDGSQAPFDSAAQAAYLAAQLAVQPQQEGEPVPALSAPYGRTASGRAHQHRHRHSAGAEATDRPIPAPAHYYVHPTLGTMPNIVPPRVPARTAVASLPRQPSHETIVSPANIAPASSPGIVVTVKPASPLRSAPVVVFQIGPMPVRQSATPSAVTLPAANLQSSAQSLPSIHAAPAVTNPVHQSTSNPATVRHSQQAEISSPNPDSCASPSSRMVPGLEPWYASRSPPGQRMIS